MIAEAWAQAAERGPAPSFLVQIFPLLLVFVVFYFLLIRPQQQKQREHRRMIQNLKKNDEVVTAGGLYGTIVALDDRVVTLEVAPKVHVRVQRDQIASLAKKENGKKEKAK
ncbi:MAG: preprotein translocase subunit YajC [Candidatus Binatia bacterium]|nr:MAG: preprotein translocase subunit YajC [Candidatus Binatia bacterium]